jgi:hypothetical protein
MTIRVTSWRTSSYSGSQGGNCVEVAAHGRRVLLRDTKQAETGLVLRFPAEAWRRFTDEVKRS